MEPRKIDPWEARERERAKREAWRQGKKRSSSAAASAAGGGDIVEKLLAGGEGGFDFRNNALPLGLLVAVILLLLASLPFDGLPAALAYRSFFTKAGSILLLFSAIVGGGNVGRNALSDVRRGPHPLLILLLLWTTFCLFLAPFRGYAALEFVRIIDGVAAYFLAGYALKNGGKQAANLTVGLLGFGCILSLLQIAEIGQQGGFRSDITMSRLGAHGNIGSVLLLLWPPALAFAVWPGMEDKRRVAALAASLIIGCALLAERARSSWIGAAASVLVLAVCYFLMQSRAASAAPPRRARQTSLFARAAGSPLTLLIVGLVILLAFGGSTAVRFVAGRAATLGSGAATGGATFQSRLVSWSGAALMTRERPLTGWGLGTFPVLQGRWTHVGVEVEAALQDGADNLSLAHNYYLQWAADTGYPGLFLYMAFLAAFVVTLVTKLPHLRLPFQKALVSGVLAVVVGSHVDALASPAHHFHGVWTLLWVWMGLALAALRPVPVRANHNEDAVQIAPLVVSNDDEAAVSSGGFAGALAVWGSGAVLGGVAVFCLAAFAARLVSEGKRSPRGTLEVVAIGTGTGQAGATLSWTARFHNNKGVSLPTSPGTTWSLQGSDKRITQAAQPSLYVRPIDPMDLTGEKRFSEFRVLVPVDAVRAARIGNAQTPPQVFVKATYFDAYGRRYEAWSIRTLAIKTGDKIR